MVEATAPFIDWAIRAWEFVRKHERSRALREEVRDRLPIALANGEVFVRFRNNEVAALAIFTPMTEGILAGVYVLVAPRYRPAPDLLAELASEALATWPSSAITYVRRTETLISPSLKPRVTKCPASPVKSEKAVTPPSRSFKDRFLARWRASESPRSSSSSSSPPRCGIPLSDDPSSYSSRSSERQALPWEDRPLDEVEDVEPAPFPQTW